MSCCSLCIDSTTVHHMLIFLPPPVPLNSPGHTRMHGQFSFTNCYGKSHLDISCFSKTDSPTTLHLKYFIYLILNPCLLGHPWHQHFWIAQIHGPMHQNRKVYLMARATLYPSQVHCILLRWFIQPIGPLEVSWLVSMKFEVNMSQKIKKRTGVQSLCAFQCLIKTVQANPGIVLTLGFVLESNWFYQATVKLKSAKSMQLKTWNKKIDSKNLIPNSHYKCMESYLIDLQCGSVIVPWMWPKKKKINCELKIDHDLRLLVINFWVDIW